ncbi:MAG: hypothetical protein AABY87_06510 [bacterium]
MVDIFIKVIYPRLGLILNFIGTILIAISFGKNLEDAHQTDSKGRPVYLVKRPSFYLKPGRNSLRLSWEKSGDIFWI